MLSKYFQIKTNTKKFDDDLLWSMGEIRNRRVILYGAGQGFLKLNEIYDFKNNLNIVAIADKKFECVNNCECECGSECSKEILGIRTIAPSQIVNEDYDVILITNEYAKPILKYLFEELKIENKDIRTVFNEEVKDEQTNLNYLYKHNFDKTLPKLLKRLKNKKVVFYGAGVYLELIKKYFDISSLNVIAISDKKFENMEESEFLGYKTCSPDKIKDLNPDYVIITTKFYINIFEYLNDDLLKGTKIKIKPLVRKSFWTLVKEIWK